MNHLTPYTNGEFDLAIEPHETDGFRVQAPGLARALGFRDAYRMLESIPAEEKGYTTARTPGGEQRVGYVTEAGFYRALGQRQPARITSENARAMVERFQAWVYREVLPSLRKAERPAAHPELVSRADLARMVLESEEEKAVMAAALESAAPAIAYHERYVSSDDVATVKVWGAQFGLTERQAYDLLIARKIVYRHSIGSRWSRSKQRVVEEHEYRARAGRVTFAWFDLRPQHNAPRHHNGQVRQTLYVRQEHALALGRKVGLQTIGTQGELVGGAA
jgi:prophage antirepressor-like protein